MAGKKSIVPNATAQGKHPNRNAQYAKGRGYFLMVIDAEYVREWALSLNLLVGLAEEAVNYWRKNYDDL